ncbi:DUF4276 family protein [Nonomuraea sp. CA-143628]|uniref:DUF4276 family protein n=1 Tax=Nonomuraea sp. CA-143628 TaxID=3239997 RepID=UPI003D8EE8E8
MSGPVTIASIVEGHGEMTAVPELLRRIAYASGIWEVRVPEPQRVPRGSMIAPGGIEAAVRKSAALHITGPGGILVLIDADKDCPAALGPALLSRAREARGDKEIAVVIAHKEFEAWFLAAAKSLSGRRGLIDPLEPPPDPEGIRDAKGWLTAHKIDGTSYKETADQAALAALFDLEQARGGAPSFDKFCRDVERLLRGGS